MSKQLSKLKELEEEYKVLRSKQDASSLELVKLEDRIWHEYKIEHGKGAIPSGGRREYFHAKYGGEFGGKVSEYEARATVFNAGAWAHTLFDQIDRGFIKLSFATLAVREAKNLAITHQVDHDIALKQVIQNITGVKRAPSAGTAPTDKQPGELPEASAEFEKSANANSKAFTARVKVLADAYIESAFKGVYIDEYHKKRIIADFKDSVALLVSDLKRDIYKVKQNTKDEGIHEVGETNFTWACEVLGFNYTFGHPINMRTVKTRKNKRSLELHPDRNPGNAAVAKEFQRVQDAYNLLAQYSEKNNRRAT